MRQGKFDVSYSDIVNYMPGHGDWSFDDYDARDLIRGELIGDLSDEEFQKIIEWCYQNF